MAVRRGWTASLSCKSRVSPARGPMADSQLEGVACDDRPAAKTASIGGRVSLSVSLSESMRIGFSCEPLSGSARGQSVEISEMTDRLTFAFGRYRLGLHYAFAYKQSTQASRSDTMRKKDMSEE